MRKTCNACVWRETCDVKQDANACYWYRSRHVYKIVKIGHKTVAVPARKKGVKRP